MTNPNDIPTGTGFPDGSPETPTTSFSGLLEVVRNAAGGVAGVFDRPNPDGLVRGSKEVEEFLAGKQGESVSRTPPETLVFLLPGTVINDQFTVLGKISEGGFGVVLKVSDPLRTLPGFTGPRGSFLDGFAALKFCLGDNAAVGDHEATLGARIRTPGFVHVSGPRGVQTYAPPDHPFVREWFGKAFPGKPFGPISGREIDVLAKVCPHFAPVVRANFQVMDLWNGDATEAVKQSRVLSDAEHLQLILGTPGLLENFLIECAKFPPADVSEVAALIRRRPRLLEQLTPLGTLLAMTSDVVKPLYHMHHVHVPPVLHRDIKPGNILFHNHTPGEIEAHGRLRSYGLGDLGVAASVEASSVNGKVVAGTSCFIPPDPFRLQDLERIDGRWDLYALGITLGVLADPDFRLPYDIAGRKLGGQPYELPHLNERPRPLPKFDVFRRLYGFSQTVPTKGGGEKTLPALSGTELEGFHEEFSRDETAEFVRAREIAEGVFRGLVTAMLDPRYENRIHLSGRCADHPNGCPDGISFGHRDAIFGAMDWLMIAAEGYFHGRRPFALRGAFGPGGPAIMQLLGPKDLARLRRDGARTDKCGGPGSPLVAAVPAPIDRRATNQAIPSEDPEASRISTLALEGVPAETHGLFGKCFQGIVSIWK